MQAVHLDQGRISVKDTHLRERPPGYALVRVLCAGICNTDLELQRGYYNFTGIPGHEFVGEVVESDSPRWRGKRVAGEINFACGTCSWCRRGLERHCPTRTVLGIVNQPGAFAQFVIVPERNLHEVPREIPTEHAVFIEPLAAACEILDQINFPDSARIAVLGDGKLGLLIAQVLHAHKLNVVHYGRHAEKLKISSGRGIETSTSENRPTKEFRFVVDATGSKEGLKEAVAMCEPRGTLVLKSTVHGEVPVDTAPVIVDELTLIGSRCGRFAPSIALLASGRVQVDGLIAGTFALRDAAAAFSAAAAKGALKILLKPGDE